MLIVTNGFQTEPLIQFNSFEMIQEVKGGLTISLTSLNVNNNPGHRLLAEETIVTVDAMDFRVKQYDETKNFKTVQAVSTFFDLIDQRQEGIYGGSRTFDEFVSFVLSGSGWTFTSDITESLFIENFGQQNIIALIEHLCAMFKCEYEIRPNNHVHFSKEIGGDHDFQYRYGHNIKALSRHVDTTKLKTYIEGTGANDISVSYTAPTHTTFGIRKADPIHDDSYEDAQALVDYIASTITPFPEVAFELDSTDLLNRELGERVWLIYEPMGLEFQTRVLVQHKKLVLRGGEYLVLPYKVVLGNAIPKTASDLWIDSKVDLEQSRNEFRSAITQTDNNINLKVEELNKSIAEIDIKADNIKIEVNNRITNEVAAINVRANQISLRVSDNEKRIGEIDVKADQINISVNNKIDREVASINLTQGQIQSTVTQHTNDLVWQQSQITQTSNSLQLKVDRNGVISAINMSPEQIDIQASRINLRGSVTVLSELSDQLGSITAGNISGVNITGANIRISEDVYIGNILQIGPSYMDSAPKLIKFGSNTGGSIAHRNDAIIMSAMNGVMIDNEFVGTTNSPGQSWNYNNNPTVPRIYFRSYGMDLGYIELKR